ncbi:uncharacterized protein N0V89_001078 [Didymosphaeria variabile]|uniref:Mis12-domain-containing protein n=1 Tax=Didymosphaeria variabile TaxID=1932322 RepID=A0A9W9CFJ5_9PLEO|nr:uncharacterized protein N0V89_001078 [Didymosphaeria variabile]KAJ4360513.1 hypothetical protein N0V89_001078 [Didymosphaeria variabile]
MAHAKQHENLLLTEHFTWPPISLIDDIINTVNDSLYSCNDTLETGLLSADPSFLGFTPRLDESEEQTHERARLEIEEGAQKLETLMIDAVDRNFDRLEIWTLRNVLCLPREEGFENWVRLSHYEGLKIPPKNNTLTPEALYALRRKLVETSKLHAALVTERTRNEVQIARLRALFTPPKQVPRSSTASEKDKSEAQGTAPFAFLTHAPAAQALGVQALPLPTTSTKPESRTPLTTHTTFTTSQLPHLRQLLAQLKPHLASSALPSGKSGESEERAKERRVYIESQSRRVLERRGVDTRDGVEGNVEGSRVRVEELSALEGIVGTLDTDRTEDGEAMDTS